MNPPQTLRTLEPRLLWHHGCRGMRLVPGPVAKDPLAPFMREEYFDDPSRPYEARFDNGYPTVIHDEEAGLIRLYYTSFVADPASTGTPLSERAAAEYEVTPQRRVALCYAESVDGVHWTKPDLGLVDFDGSSRNNILMDGAHGSSVLLDPDDPDVSRRFKLLTRIDTGSGHHMAVAFSADGVHFGEPKPWPRHNPVADTHNVAFRLPEGGYGLITRTWRDGLRVPALSTSQDFLDWSPPLECAPLGGAWSQLYSVAVLPVGDTFIGWGSLYHDGDRDRPEWDLVDLVLMYASDPGSWHLPLGHQSFLARGEGVYPGGAFDAGCLYAAAPIRLDGRWWLYYMGGNGRHTGFRETGLGRAEIDLDRLAGYTPVGSVGTLTLGPLTLGPSVEVLADVEPGGEVVVRVCDRAGRPVPDSTPAVLAGRGWQPIKLLAPADEGGSILSLECRDAIVYGLRGDLELQPRP